MNILVPKTEVLASMTEVGLWWRRARVRSRRPWAIVSCHKVSLRLLNVDVLSFNTLVVLCVHITSTKPEVLAPMAEVGLWWRRARVRSRGTRSIVSCHKVILSVLSINVASTKAEALTSMTEVGLWWRRARVRSRRSRAIVSGD
jgi:hypothetical protein